MKILLFIAAWLPLLAGCQGKPAPVQNQTLSGEALYMKHCTMCHQPDGSGVSGMYPPLKQTDWVSGDPDKLVGLILKGQQGNIEVNGKSYKGVMPAQNLSDEEIARVLTYIRSSFGNHLPAVAPDQVAKARKLLH